MYLNDDLFTSNYFSIFFQFSISHLTQTITNMAIYQNIDMRVTTKQKYILITNYNINDTDILVTVRIKNNMKSIISK